MSHDAAPRAMARLSLRLHLVLALLVTVVGGCERQPRAREREAVLAAAQERARAAEAARKANEPPPEEPPVELVRSPHSGLPCKVDDVFANKCRRCHTIPTRHGAPFVFLTWDDTRQDRLGQPLFAAIGRAVRSNYMPYRIPANPPVEPLTDEEKKIILDWVDAGAPREDYDPNAPPASANQAASAPPKGYVRHAPPASKSSTTKPLPAH